uniref:Uncharacterized protein n=1 Tax=Arundo donax TaxID=35708 RepID=A0A0A9C640_ARUDO
MKNQKIMEEQPNLVATNGQDQLLRNCLNMLARYCIVLEMQKAIASK